MSPTLILLAALAQFILGALWYSPLVFGKQWMQIMGADTLAPEELRAMQKRMLPFYVLQFLLTVLFTAVLAFDLYFAQLVGLSISAYAIAGGIWLGFVVPTQVAGVIWGSTPRRYWLQQCLIMMGCQCLCILLAAAILTY